MSSQHFVEYEACKLPPGIYAPIPTPFSQDQSSIDEAALVNHALRLAEAGVGLVISGSTGEAISLTRKERAQAVSVVRKALLDRQYEDARYSITPIVAGTGAGSLVETIELCHDAQKAGADAVIVIVPGYFASLLATDRLALKDFFWRVADASPLPVMVYNFPASAGGIDLDSEILEEIAVHPNICGAKLTCANVGKAGRLANSHAVLELNKGRAFHVCPGFADIIFPCMMIGCTGAIVGTANILPKLCVSHFHHITEYLKHPSKDLLAKIQKEQDLISRADRALSKPGVPAVKWLLSRHFYNQGEPRKPLQPTPDLEGQELEKALFTAMDVEKSLKD